MNLLMIGGDQSILKGEKGPFWYTLQDLSKQFDRIDVLCARNEHPILDSSIPIHGNVYLHPSPVGVVGLKKWLVTKGQQLHAAHRIDRITVHAYPPFVHFLGALKLANIVQVTTMCEWHGIHSFSNGSSWQDHVGAVLTRLLAKKSNQLKSVRSVSGNVTKQLTQFGVQADVIKLVPAVYIDPTIWQYNAHVSKQYDIVFCGRIDANKRLDRIITVLESVPTITLVIIGDGPERKHCETLAKKLGVNERITWLGWLKTPIEVASIVQASNVLCMPSGYEGGPRVVAEALAAGVPVVATNVGIVPDIVRHGYNGRITNGTVEALIQDVTTVLNTAIYADTAQVECAHVRTTYNRSLLVKHYIEWLRS